MLKHLQQITNKHYDIPVSQNSLSVGLKLKNRVKLTVNRWTVVCVDQFQSIWHQLKFRVNELQLEANKSTAKLFFGKASGTKKRTALLRKLFSFYKNVVFQEHNFSVKLKTCQCILFPNFHWNYILFQISTLGLNMSYSEMSQI